jgi:predicted nucleic acid-binding protein
LPTFLKLAIPTDTAKLSRLCQELDPGEAEAICLASELQADRLLIDESVGRRVALREGLSVIGLVGVLVLAKANGILAALGPVLQQLENDAGFRLAPSLKLDALRAVGEA